MKSIFWLRTDLRINDNEALYHFLKSNHDLLIIFPKTKSFEVANSLRKNFLNEHFDTLKIFLEKNGLKVLRTELTFFQYLNMNSSTQNITSIYFTKEYAFDERQEEIRVLDYCEKENITCFSFDQSTLIKLHDLPFSIENMPFIFTDFRKKIEANLKVSPIIESSFSLFENKGHQRLKHYLWDSNRIQTYKETRNGLLDFDDSSKLSPWLNLGAISPREIYYELKKYESKVCENESTYWLFFELLWRDYFKFFSLKFGNKIFLTSGVKPGPMGEKNLKVFQTWCDGKTKDEFVNANMKELNATGWMSNRGRQNVASYLIHDLGINWTWGAAYFEKQLIDYDPDLNWGNWLYLSGHGSDPRARKFNTVKQAETYDPNGDYRKLWSKPKVQS